ncbi:gravitropic in the light 1-like protein [Tanacetum coccineum]
MLCGEGKSRRHHRNLKMNLKPLEPMSNLRFQYPIQLDMDTDDIIVGALKPSKISNKNVRGITKLANKVSSFSHLIHRVTDSISCFQKPESPASNFTDHSFAHHDELEEHDACTYKAYDYFEDEGEVEEECVSYETKKEMEMVVLLGEVFERVSYMKNAYVSLQDAHCPWNPDKIRLSDVAVVTELRKLGFLQDRFHKSIRRNTTTSDLMLREMLAPYEVALENLTADVKNKAALIDNLRDKLKSAIKGGRRKSRSSKVSCSSQFEPPSPSPTASTISAAKMEVSEQFESCMSSVKEASRTFAKLLLSLMKSAHWDITATVKSITGMITTNTTTTALVTSSLESYINYKIFQGFNHESFNMDDRNILSSNMKPSQYRTECFTQYTYMKSVDPMELLGIIPTCLFGKFCLKKYLSIMHPKMEISLLGDLEQRQQVLAENHPRSRFYNEYLGVVKAVWLLHLFAFSLDPLPSHFEGNQGAEFHPQYMESAVPRMSGDVVGFPVSPGFKLGNGYVVKARVYLVPNGQL